LINYLILVVFLFYGAITLVFTFANFIPNRFNNSGKAVFFKVTVIVPCKDEEAVIEDTLNAIKAQTYPLYDVIIVDDN